VSIDLSDRLPPYNIQAEQGVLGSILLNNDVLPDVVGMLKTDDFYRDSHQIAFRAIRDMFEAGDVIDVITLPDELTRRGVYSGIGGDDFLTEIVHAVPHALDATYYAGIVKGKSIARQIADSSSENLRDVYSNNFTADQLLERASTRIWAIDNSDTAQTETAADLLPQVMDRMTRRVAGGSYGIPTGFREFDSMTDGMQPGELMLLAARPSMGKTALSLNIADDVTIRQGKPVLFVSLEMSNGLLVERMVVKRAGVDSHRIRMGLLSPSHWDEIHRANEQIAAAPIHLVRRNGLTITEISAAVRRAKFKHGIELVIIDYIQLIDGGATRESEVQVLTRISRCLKLLAIDLKIPVLALSQLNRQAENREDRRPRMADLRGSGSLEQDADLIALLYRPEYYDPNEQPGVAELDLAKNRNGPVGTFKLTFEKHLMRFTSLSNADETTYGADNAPF
jgi:replicative DNA helicase